jgi:hypothetical protein
MIDYQDRFPEYHTAAPADPVPSPAARSLLGPVADDGPSNDPLVGEAEIRAALR